MNDLFEEHLQLTSLELDGAQYTFLLNSQVDHIQQFLARKEFYEREELELLVTYCAGRKRLLDVGANIGNHSIFLAHRLNLERVTPIEPSPAILHILKANLGLNWHRSFDLAHLGIALSDHAGWAEVGSFHETNIGGMRLVESDGPGGGPSPPMPLRAGDDLFQPGDFDIVKIDVEGMEIQVIDGLRRFLGGFDGVIFVEVHDDNLDDFTALVSRLGFRKRAEYRRYRKCVNWIVTR